MNLLLAELRKVWGDRVFPLLVAVLAATNLLLLWMGTRPVDDQPPAAAYRAVGAELAGLSMAEKGTLLHEAFERTDGLLTLKRYYRDLAWAGEAGMSYYLTDYHAEHADLFEKYEQLYKEESYTLYTDSLETEYRLFKQLADEYDTVAGYTDFLAGVQTRAGQLAGISIFQNDASGYDIENIELTAQVYADLGATPIAYYPQKGLYTAISCAFTDLLLLAAMLLLALLLVRQERDSGLLGLVRSLPGGRLKTAAAKLAAFALSLLAMLAVLYGVNLVYCAASFGLGPLDRTIQSVPALMRCTMQITVGAYLVRFLLAKWAGAFVMGLWVMLAALAARRAAAGWAAALAVPLAMYGIRAAIPATARLNVVKYANLASLLQTNELLGSYRNLYWFGHPVGLPPVEWTVAVLYGAGFLLAFCLLFARAWLLPAPARSFVPVPGRARKTRPTTVAKEEARKLFRIGGAGLVFAAFLGFGIRQGVTAQSYLGPDEIYYAHYMDHISGPLTKASADWLAQQGEEFVPMLQAQAQAARGELPPEALYAYGALEQKYSVYRRIVDSNINAYLKEHPGAWLVYESGYRRLFTLIGSDSGDIQDALLAGLACAMCFPGLFALERRGGMDEILRSTPRGRGRTAAAKLALSAALSVGIALAGCVPHLWQILRDYGLPALTAPAMSIPEYAALPAWVTLSDVLLFWILCRAAACLCMGTVTLWLGQMLGSVLPALFLSAAAYGLPPLLALSGMDNGIQWLGVYPLFHAAALLGVQGYDAGDTPRAAGWVPALVCLAALLVTAALAQALYTRWEWAGQDLDI